MGALLAANAWLFDSIRYAGALYLAWLGYKSARAALRPGTLDPKDIGANSYGVAWAKGALIHLTNPKAVVFWGSIFAIGLKPGAPPEAIGWIVAICLVINVTLVTGYALLFSSQAMTAGYLRLRRWFEAVFAAFFGFAAFHLLTSKNP